MATVISMDGLGGHPANTFDGVKNALESDGHKVVLVNIEGIQTSADRCQRVLTAFHKEKSLLPKSIGDKRIFLMGQSAGGGAVCDAAGELIGDDALTGVISLSRSMPFLEWYMTSQLWKGMKWRLLDLAFARTIYPSEEEYTPLIEPLAESLRSEVIKNRQAFPGREARKLAFYANRLARFTCPLLLIWGEKDQWISPAAHRKLARKLESYTSSPIVCREVPGAGHLTLSSDRRNEVIEEIKTWMGSFPY